MFIKNLSKTEGNIKCIPNNEERYISFSKDIKVYNYTDKETGDAVYTNHELRFIDSFKFMSSSLDELTSNLTACGKCDSCRPGDCLKRYVEGCKLIQYKGIGSCDRCINCQLVKKSCFKPTTKRLRETSKIYGEKASFFTRKGVYPYDYMDSLRKLSETQLPPKEAFYSKLNKSHISDEDYEHKRSGGSLIVKR